MNQHGRQAVQDQRLLTLDGQGPEVLTDVSDQRLSLVPLLVEPSTLQLQLITAPLKGPRKRGLAP